MKILYDHQTFELQNYGGISRYFSDLIEEVSKIASVEVGIKYSNNEHLADKGIVNTESIIDHRQKFLKNSTFIGKGRLFNIVKKIRPSSYPDFYKLNKQHIIDLLKAKKFDVFHPTYYDPYFLDYMGNKPFVITIHDMTYELFPEYFPISDKTSICQKEIALKASQIIAVSENTKKDIIKIWGIDEGKINVVYHGLNQSFVTNEEITLDLPEYYFLYLGARAGYKNFTFFIRSIADFLLQHKIYLLCTGSPFSRDELELFRNLNISDTILHVEAKDEILPSLYRNAIAYISPSLYEGFGLPVIEAFQNDCPVILSDASCYTEIAGDAALYFNPKDAAELILQLRRIIEENGIRDVLIKRGRSALDTYTIENSAKKTLEVYEIATYLP